jgi:hypothetical protein
MALDECPRIYSQSAMTPSTLISGGTGPGGSDPSLIPKLDGMVLTIKDFTVVLEMPEMARDAIFSQLRDAYDGVASKDFGTGQSRKYKSNFGILAGVTESIERFLEGATAMGERFLGYKFPIMSKYEERAKIMRMAMNNIAPEDDSVGNKDIMRKALADIAQKALNYDFGKPPYMPEEIRLKIMAISDWTAKMRGTVHRNKWSKEIERKAEVEMPTRIATQLTKFCLGFAQWNRRKVVTEEEFRVAKLLATGSAPYHLETIVRRMYLINKTGSFQENDFAKMLRLPPETCKRFADNLHQLRVLRKKTPKGSMIGTWSIDKEVLEQIEISEVYNSEKGKSK